MTSSLRIGRLRSTYLVPRDHPAPEDLRFDLDNVARQHVADACAKSLDEILDERDPSVWVIDRVAADLLMDVGCRSQQEVALFWGRKLAESVLRTIAGGDDGEHVVHFASRAEYLAQFLADLAAGRAWNRWFYGQFESLRSLPAGPAIRQALVREPDYAEKALLHLVRTRRGAVIAILSAIDAEIVLDLLAVPSGHPNWPLFRAALNAWRIAEPCDALALQIYLDVRARDEASQPADVRTAVAYMFAASRWACQSGGDIFSRLASGQFARAVAAVPTEDYAALAFLRVVLEESPDRLQEIRPLQDLSRGAATHFLDCDLGGLLLLLPSLIQMTDLPRVFFEESAAYLRFALLLKCAGPEARHMWLDPALSMVAGIEGLPEASRLEELRLDVEVPNNPLVDLEYFRLSGFKMDPAMERKISWLALNLLRRFALSLPGLGSSSPQYLWRNLLAGSGRVKAAARESIVELTPRPLAIVLRMAGFHSLRIALPWSPDIQVTLQLREE